MYAMSTRQGLLAGRSTDRVGELYIHTQTSYEMEVEVNYQKGLFKKGLFNVEIDPNQVFHSDQKLLCSRGFVSFPFIIDGMLFSLPISIEGL